MAKNTSILLGDYYEDFVAEKVQSGQYNSASEVIRTALRMFEEQERKKVALIDALIKGEKSKIITNFNGKAFLDKMHKKVGMK
jgi:antitoxin ParD1/3/4